jgi:FADH2 O2-dependent halogenase
VSKQHFQIVVVGSGFAGSLMAMIAHQLGYSTALLERGRHPRFAIGESSTPLANLLLEEISDKYDLPFVRPLCKWGSWQKQIPQLACGLKRGFTFYHHQFGRPFESGPDRQNQLMVGASPNEEIADTHWYRAEFDHYLVGQAQNLGVTYWDQTALTNCAEETPCMRLSGTRDGESIDITTDFVVDASGPRGFLHRALGLPEKTFAGFPRTQALFSHFQNLDGLPPNFSDNEQAPPYPPEQAAVHHIFPGGWIWVLKFNNGITSAGVAATEKIANELEFSSGEPAWRRLLEKLPSLNEAFRSARAIMPFIHTPHLPFQSEVVTGPRWALLPSAAGFVDPLLSTGFPLTLLGITRIAELLKSGLRDFAFQPRLHEYAKLAALELETTGRLVSALYATMEHFDFFKQLSLLYFTAASYSETVWRLGKPHLADGFLLCHHPVFAGQVRQICQAVQSSLSPDSIVRLTNMIREAIEPFDVAGLTDKSRRSWYPALPSDLLRNARKVEATELETLNLLERLGIRAN